MAARRPPLLVVLPLLLALSLAAAMASMSLISAIDRSLRGAVGGRNRRRRRLLSSSQHGLARFFDPKSVAPRNVDDGVDAHPIADDRADDHPPPLRRSNCQVIYVLGVEGSIHHGFMPVIKSLADRQVDPLTGLPFRVVKGHDALRSAIFGFEGLRENSPPMDDPDLVRTTVDAMCPPVEESWRPMHVIIEGNSFPSGGPNNDNLQFRVRRRRDWSDMTPERISEDDAALNHPTSLYKFYDAFSPYVDVRFVALHRPYLETVASHMDFDSGPEKHSSVISGFLLLLGRFLTGHVYGDIGHAAVVPLWTIVCADKLSSRQYETQQQLFEARENVVGYLADFLGWPGRSCPECFGEWKESGKTGSPEERLGGKTTKVLLRHVARLKGVWPPRREEDRLPEQQCRM